VHDSAALLPVGLERKEQINEGDFWFYLIAALSGVLGRGLLDVGPPGSMGLARLFSSRHACALRHVGPDGLPLA
jgi:hypothetical protein